MPITEDQLMAAQEAQFRAAHDSAPQVRLVAGPGSGKSYAIGERVLNLLRTGVEPSEIAAVSFTRAAAKDLELRVRQYCADGGAADATEVNVVTLHSLALRMLRRANLLSRYPASPLVLDDWEVRNVYDCEFGAASGIGPPRRLNEIRKHHEAFWSTGQWQPSNYVPPDTPISNSERRAFEVFHSAHAQLYSCVLPGEIVRRAVKEIHAGTLDPVEILQIRHLIVDEYQDLNPMDLQFVDLMARTAVTTFVAGDDDQSIYSFRHAAPIGIQEFPSKYQECSDHELAACFRCTPGVLGPAMSLIQAHATHGRIRKALFSVYSHTEPRVNGRMHRWKFKSADAEAAATAESCKALIDHGHEPGEIMVLMANTHVQERVITRALEALAIDFEPPKAQGFLDSDVGRAAHALVRIGCERDDYVAHRVLLGVCRGIGVSTCNQIGDAILSNNLNFRDSFYGDLPAGVLETRAANLHGRVAQIVRSIEGWERFDEIGTRKESIKELITQVRGSDETEGFGEFIETLPDGMVLGELRDFMWSDNPSKQETVLKSVYARLGEPDLEDVAHPPRVRLMTMHGAKGLSAKVVFIPGLEDAILPGSQRAPFPGLVQEAARLLYVSITRARAACIASFALTRMTYGDFGRTTPSRFCSDLNGQFQFREKGLTDEEVSAILNNERNL